jgi:formylglycine-generating enzyme required for sulfatase activity
LDFSSRLKYDPAPSSTKQFVNGFGQRLVWFGSLGGWVDSKEVTQDVYDKVMGGAAQNPSSFKAPSHPVDSVTWYKAVQFAEKLTILERGLGNLPTGYRYRLPTDLEWSEYVGRQDLNDAVTSVYERLDSTRPVGSMKPNEYGLFDVRGNVWEWCSDWYSQSVVNRLRKEGASANSQWIGTERKVLRGGAWNRSSQYELSIANRRAAQPSTQGADIGFRVVLMPN